MTRLIFTSDLPSKGVRFSRAHRDRLIKQGKFPKPVKGLGKENAFVESEIDALVEQRIAERGTASRRR
jgi:predicted DNA-binding transcriptional regulator AlpA